MRLPVLSLVVVAASLVAGPGALSAQHGSGARNHTSARQPSSAAQVQWWSWALPRVEGGARVRTASNTVVIVPRRDGERQAASGGRGPKFCRDGRGHPVHGWRWCEEKGFAPRSIWSRGGIGDVILRNPTRRGALDRGGLIDVLGRVVLGRLAGGSSAGTGGALTGRIFVPERGRTVVQVRSGAAPLAELTDLDGDGRVDVVLLANGR